MVNLANRPKVDLADFIEHTLLDPFATPDRLEQLCHEADRYRFPMVCVFPTWVPKAVDLLHRSSTQVCTVIGFPTGAQTSATKQFEAQEAIEAGADGLDLVINLGWLRAGHLDAVHREVAEICDLSPKPVKAILEMTKLTPQEKTTAAEICMDAGVAYLKTSTGWFGGATVEDIKLLSEIACDRVGIKASGGIRTYEQALDLIQAGATRLGTSRGVELIKMQEQWA